MNRNQTIIIDFSAETLIVSINSAVFRSNVSTNDFFLKSAKAFKDLKKELTSYKIKGHRVIYSLPVRFLAHQAIPLPLEAPEQEKLKLISIELDRTNFTNNFHLERLENTSRLVAGERICDFLLIAPQKKVLDTCNAFSKSAGLKLFKFSSSLYLFTPGTRNDTVSAFIENDHREIVYWNDRKPVALSNLAATDDPVNDINRFVDIYQNQLEGKALNIESIEVFGSTVNDYSFGNMTYRVNPHSQYLDVLAGELPRVETFPDLAAKVKLPSEPYKFDTPNVSYLASIVCFALVILIGAFTFLQGYSLDKKYKVFKSKVSKYENLIDKKKKVKKNLIDLEKEKDFFYSITRRRVPWNDILGDLSRVSPKGLWIERMSAAKSNLIIVGKAESVEDVSQFSVNLNYNSKFFKDAQLTGSRDFIDGELVFKEYQITMKLKSPEESLDAEAKTDANPKTGEEAEKKPPEPKPTIPKLSN
ncbi:MAG: PilN domain-containing protein [Candidatus Caenarcaniphilales bacterium]|nr:PilN domain-containing protein [Candidatus Caenarcaniphilales bacterium]